jgi:hypothetical protein
LKTFPDLFHPLGVALSVSLPLKSQEIRSVSERLAFVSDDRILSGGIVRESGGFPFNGGKLTFETEVVMSPESYDRGNAPLTSGTSSVVGISKNGDKI